MTDLAAAREPTTRAGKWVLSLVAQLPSGSIINWANVVDDIEAEAREQERALADELGKALRECLRFVPKPSDPQAGAEWQQRNNERVSAVIDQARSALAKWEASRGK